MSELSTPSLAASRTPDPSFPYSSLRESHIWSGRALDSEGNAYRGKFEIARGAKISTAGSCFAERLADGLRSHGLSYFATEANAGPLAARYGNIYTARQLLQLLQRSLRIFEPLDRAWRCADGSFVDPFRPRFGRFETARAVEIDRSHHLDMVRRLFENVDVFVFTLGLTERWFDARDGAVFPTCPGRGVGIFLADRYAWANGDVDTTIEDLETFLTLLSSVNPAAKLIISVSPVAIAATLLPLPVIRASTLCKATLKVAAETFAGRHSNVDYFPSYELITSDPSGTNHYMQDGRHVAPASVERVCAFFVSTYVDAGPVANCETERETPIEAAEASCDEDVLLKLILRNDDTAAPESTNRVIEPMYFLGDSNTLVFRDRVFAEAADGRVRIGRVLHTPALFAVDFTRADGSFNGKVLDALVMELLLAADGRGGYTAFRRDVNQSLNFALDRADERVVPPLVVSCGSLDMTRILEELGGKEFDLPVGLRSLPRGSPPFETVSFDYARRIAEPYFVPLEIGLRRLVGMGLTSCCLLALPPPGRAVHAFPHMAISPSIRAHYHVIVLINSILSEICRRTSVRFVDTWPVLIAADGFIDDRFYLDGVHTNAAAAREIFFDVTQHSSVMRTSG